MDLLSKRYASPCFLLDGYIQTGRFAEFVDSIVTTINKEKHEEVTWEFYLHKVFEGTYSDFVAEMQNTENNANMSEESMETIVNSATNILNNFTPNGG